MKRKLSLFLLAFFAVAAFAAQPSKKAMVEKSYTITFQETGTESDASTALTTVEEIIDQGAEYVSEVSATKVYKGRAGRGVKLGSSSAIGELKLTLAEVVKPSKIVVKARKYNDKGENYISINDNEFTLSAGDGEDCVIEYDGETEVSEIDIKTTSGKPRTYVISVSVFYSEDTGEDPVSVYTITGAVADAPYYGVEEPSFFGTAWDATVTANDLVKGEDGLYTKTYENVYLLASHFIFYQVVKDRTETLGSKKREMITSDGTYNVVFTFNPEDNSVSVALNSTAEPAPVYTLVGSVKESKYFGEQEASFFGEAWAPNFSSNDMEKGADGIYTKSFSNVQLLAQNYIEYKVVKNHDYANGEWGFGSNNANYIVTEDGEYNITFKFNPDATFDNGYNVDVVVEKITPQPQLNTYEVYVSNVPEGFGRPYAYVWSVVDGVDVPVTAWPGTRMGPWQFDNGDMGYIFQIEAAEAPQFIIFNNGQSGEGNQTADLEFVNRETYDLTELMTPPVVEDDVYTITGAVADAPYYGTEEPSFFGTAWDATVTANDLVKGEDGLYTKTFENVYLQASHFVMYQVVKNRTQNIGSKARQIIIADGSYNVVFTFNPEDNSVTCDLQSTAEPAPVYTLVGSVKESKYYGEQEASFFGEAWAPEYSANDMEKGADGLYTKTFENVHLLSMNYIEYKVVKNHSYDEGQWGFGDSNANYWNRDDGNYNITFKFNPDATFDNGYNVDIVLEKVVIPQPTHQIFVKNVPEGFGRPYAYTWSVVDGEPVPTAEWPGTQMGVYEFANGESGFVYEIEAAEAPQFVIFNNGQTGDGNQTADLEFIAGETYDLGELLTPAVEPFDYEKIAITPADHATVESLQSFTLTFGGQVVTVNEDVFPTLAGQDGGIALNDDGSVSIDFEEAVTAPGNYTLEIPSGAILYNGTALDPLSFTYTIAGGGAEFTIEPAAGVVESLSTFVVDFGNTMLELDDDAKAYLFNEETEEEIAGSVMLIGGDKKVFVSLEEEVTAPGEYQLNIEGVKKMDGTPVELIFNYTISDGTPDQNYYILGDFWGWDNPKQMEQSADDENVYTLEMDFTAEAKAYEYKLRQGDNWEGYQLPASGNKSYTFDEAGDYTLTFTANVAEHSLDLVAVKKGEDVVYTITGAVTDHPRYGTEEAGFFGAMWDATVSANDMVKGDDGKYTKTFENVYVNPPYYILYQVVKNQTEAIGEKATFTAENGGMYNVVFTFNPEDNSVTCELQSNVEPEPVYTLVGGVNTTEGGQEDVLFGTTWEPTLEANDMEKGADGIYTKSFEKVALSYGDQILYKVAKNHAWSETWGFGTENADYSIQDDGEYNITFKFNPDAAFDNGFNVDVVVEKIQPVLNTYEVYVANVPEGFGRPYAYVWSMVDGEAVPVAAWPGTRMGPWQFDNGDMGYIFQIEAAEAPQFIIFNNGQGGEGNQTADLEFVNRQTYDLTELMTPAVEPFDYEKIAITPADHATVESLQSFTLTFGGQVVTVNEDVFPTLAGQDGGIALNDDGSVSIDFEEAVTAPGNYTLEIPSGAILYDGTALDPLSFTYTIAGGGAEFTIEPAAGVVESLSTFVVDFGNTMLELDDDAKAYLFNEETEEEIAGSVMLIGGDKKVYVSLEGEVTAPGEYQLNIEGVKKMDGTPVELIFNYTISDGTPDQNYYILGDFWGWDNPKQMEQSADDENVYTLEMDFTAEAKAYEYKLRQGDNWEGYQLPASGNKSYTFDEAGDYTLTFTANVAEHTLDLVAVKKGEDVVYTITGAVTDHPRYGTEEAGFFGAMWDATVSANDMVKGDDGKYTKTFENVYLNAPLYILYQVVKNQTEEVGVKGTQVVETGGMYNVVFTFNPEDNNVTCELQSTVEPTPVYTLVGAINTTEGGQEDVLFGKTWEPTLEANDMEKGVDGVYTKSFEKVALSYGDQILYKVVKNHAWSETWGFGTENADYTIQDDGEYNITFKFNPDATFDNGYNVDVVVEKILPPLNTYEVYLANVPEDFGRPYAYVWSMVDGEAVPVKDWPGTRMGMWQFDNGDMGYIFQIEAAEAPQFIIFNNGQSGPLNQTVDLEFVNKQTYDLVENLIPVVDEDVLVEVPADAVIETDWHFDGIYRTSQGASDVTDNTEVAFVGNDVYVKGIPHYFTDSWMKGTFSDGKAVFASGQFVGEDDYGKEYMLGYDGTNIVDIVFSYDEENHIFSLETPYILENGDSKTELSMWGYYTYLDIIKGEVIPDEPVVAPADLVTEDYVFSSEELSFDDNEEPVYEDYSADVKVGFDGNDVYVQGLCYYLPESWVKGVKDGSTVTFEAGQFFGTIYDQYDMYFVGYGESGIENVVMNYDETTGEFTTDHWILINSKKASISYYNIYTSCRLTKVGPATAIQSVEDTEEAGTVYYDTLGRRTNSNTKGLLLKQVRQADGSVKTTKVARK